MIPKIRMAVIHNQVGSESHQLDFVSYRDRTRNQAEMPIDREWPDRNARGGVSSDRVELFGQMQFSKWTDCNGCTTGDGELLQHGSNVGDRHSFVGSNSLSDGTILAALQP